MSAISRTLAVFVVLLALGAIAKADPITVTVFENGSYVMPGQSVTLTGLIMNNTSGTLYVRLDALNFNPGLQNFDILFRDEIALAPGATSSLIQFMTLTVPLNIPDPSLVSISMFFEGGPNSGDRISFPGITYVALVYDTRPLPEPATMVLLATGLAGVGAAARRRRRASKSSG